MFWVFISQVNNRVFLLSIEVFRNGFEELQLYTIDSNLQCSYIIVLCIYTICTYAVCSYIFCKAYSVPFNSFLVYLLINYSFISFGFILLPSRTKGDNYIYDLQTYPQRIHIFFFFFFVAISH